MKLYIISCKLMILFLLLNGCSDSNNYTKEQIIQKDPIAYKNDSVRLNAYHFLVENMHSFRHFNNGVPIADLNVVDRDYLMKNIDQSFISSENLLNTGLITKSDFHEYVLPYRINYAEIEYWRDLVWKRIGRNNLGDIRTEKALIDSCNAINNDLKKWFKFGNLTQSEDTLGYSGLCHYKMASCGGMSNLAAYTLRALGVPIAIDYAVWGNMSGGHIWNSLITSKNKAMPFLGAESPIDSENKFYLVKLDDDHSKKLSTYKKPGKVYRSTFSVQKQSFAFRAGRSHILPPELSETRQKDVTKIYFPITNLIIPVHTGEKKVPDFLVLCNFNSGVWIPVMGTMFNSGKFVFDDLAKDMLYNTFTYSAKRKSKAYNYPVYIDTSGNKIFLKPHKNQLIDIELNRTRSIENDQIEVTSKDWNVEKLISIAKGTLFKKPSNGKTFNLYMWDFGWKLVGVSKSINHQVKFKSIPSNGLYVFSEGERNPNDRPFIINNKKYRWL